MNSGEAGDIGALITVVPVCAYSSAAISHKTAADVWEPPGEPVRMFGADGPSSSRATARAILALAELGDVAHVGRAVVSC